jgi:preprotein translocase subunit SecY
MSSAAEQLAANFNFNVFSKAHELKKRIWYTLGALIIYRLGSYIPLTGVDIDVIKTLASKNANNFFGILAITYLDPKTILWKTIKIRTDTAIPATT